MLWQLHSGQGTGARAKLQLMISRLRCSTALLIHMLLRLYSTLIAHMGMHAISYGCEIWGSQCHGSLVSDAQKLKGSQVDVQHASFPFCAMSVHACLSLTVGTSAASIFAELAEDAWSLMWWVQLVGLALQISDLP